MRLADYLRDRKIRNADFAKRIGRSDASVSRLARGLQRPDWDTLEAIRRETEGAVTANDFHSSAQEAAA